MTAPAVYRTEERVKLPDVVHLGRVVDPPLDAVGFHWTHPYLERLWLPHIGPTAGWLYRYLAEMAEARPPSIDLSTGAMRRRIGLGDNYKLSKSVARLRRFHFCTWAPASATLLVRTCFLPLTGGFLMDHAPHDIALHRSFMAEHPATDELHALALRRLAGARP